MPANAIVIEIDGRPVELVLTELSCRQCQAEETVLEDHSVHAFASAHAGHEITCTGTVTRPTELRGVALTIDLTEAA